MSTKLEELRLDVAELNRFLSAAVRQKVKDALSVEIRKLETEITTLKEFSEKDSVPETPVSPVTTSKLKCYEVKLNNYAWDQSDKFVKIFVALKNVQTVEAANVFCEFTNRSVELKVNGLDNRNYTLPVKNLLEEIDADKSHWKVKTDNVVIFLAKKKDGIKWSHMTTHEKKANEPRLPKLDQNDDPSAGLMDMMRQMYEDGDDDMKRTIAKAWTESREKQMNF
ncbi:calcyclin-binding protein [Zootermopsis nevadensis]|uniref:Calcyclin-binding protein n=1 Tax=Zootermopsis nevadensis TaxID=136037 RepID=A0A067R418_ZOONE|nr:calcyclin-binding protein [Zootermopsis nevadensis]KDR16863.1 Calcyclin-binding protein [Zootermopsis nevadensis]